MILSLRLPFVPFRALLWRFLGPSALVLPQLLLQPRPGIIQCMAAPQSPIWQRHRGLVWSNPTADDSVHIRAALLRPRFGQLLEIAVEFGLKRVRQEWAILQAEPAFGVERARTAVERILKNIEKGFAIAASRD